MLNRMQRIGFIFTIFIFFGVDLIFIPTDAAAGDEQPELVFYNWTAYVGTGIIEAFEKSRNCKVRQAFYQSSDERDEKIMRNGGKGYDIIVVDGNDVSPYVRRGWIVPMGIGKVPNLVQMDEKWIKAWPDTETYAVPYLWGTLGIIYRSDLIDEEIVSWKQFYQPKEAWRGKIMLVDIHRIGIGMALKALGHSLNSEDPKAIDAAIALLKKQKPYVQIYGYLKTDADSGIVSGETWMGQTWSGDALLLQKRNPAIRYVIPEEGGQISPDYMVVSAHAKHPALAYDFVNYLSEASNSARAARELAFGCPNAQGRKLLPKDMIENKVIYPSRKAMKNSEFTKEIPPRMKKKMVEAWSQLKN
ncbi:MAG: spermidine/putrescine ABC transporter substrate-binding protein [Desulfobacterium sp.]|nr:spermidine/putrescine ABC transporter substrate-binding protein [Desulfobacterium sp.]